MRSAIIGLASLFLLSACGTSVLPLQPVKIDPAMIETQARIALIAVEQAAAAYAAVTPFPEADQTRLDMADSFAKQMLNNMQVTTPTDLPTMASATLQSINVIVGLIPPATLPPEARAAIAAFEVLAQNLPALIAAQQAQQAAQQPQPVIPPAAPTQPVSTPPPPQ